MITEKEMNHGFDWDGTTRVTGWYITEKHDGCRAYWDGSTLWTRSGKEIKAPASFLAELPAGVHLDGEIWAGRGRFQVASNAVRYGGKHWTSEIRFMVFDAPESVGSYPWRMADAFKSVQHSRVAKCVDIIETVTSRAHLKQLLTDIKETAGEGLMLRNPLTETYEKARTTNLLKLKSWPR